MAQPAEHHEERSLTDDIKIGSLYVLPVVFAYIVDAVIGKDLERRSNLKSKDSPTLMRYIALKSGIKWISSTITRGLFGPIRDIVDEETKDLNAKIAGWQTNSSTPPGIAEANEAFIAWAEFMNSHYSIRSQMSRANATRSLLYIQYAANSARHAFETGHQQISVELIADAAFHLRNLYGEFSVDNETIAQIIQNDFTLVSDLPANFGQLVLDALALQDDKMDDPLVSMAYWHALRAWKIIKVDTQLQYNNGDECPAFDAAMLSELTPNEDTKQKGGILATAIGYCPGFLMNVGLELFEATHFMPEGAKDLVKAVKNPLVTALSDKAAKSIESKVQKAVYGIKNSHHDPLKSDIYALSQEFDAAQETSYDLYSQKTQNGRANFARTMAILASDLNSARDYALDKDNYENAAHFVASAATAYRRIHNEAPTDFEFAVNSVHAIISNHVEWPGYFDKLLAGKISKLDNSFDNDGDVQRYYKDLFEAWNIPFQVAL